MKACGADLTLQQWEEWSADISAGIPARMPQQKEEWGAAIGVGLAVRTSQEKEEQHKAISVGVKPCWAALTHPSSGSSGARP